jgi:hypothetical protein
VHFRTKSEQARRLGTERGDRARDVVQLLGLGDVLLQRLPDPLVARG